jgi:hypothetical protein
MDRGEATFGNISGHRCMTLAEFAGGETEAVKIGSVVVVGDPLLE